MHACNVPSLCDAPYVMLKSEFLARIQQIIRMAAEIPFEFSPVMSAYPGNCHTRMASFTPHVEFANYTRWDDSARLIMKNVRSFFEQLRSQLGPFAAGTIFENVDKVTAAACGTPERTLRKVCTEEHSGMPRPKKSTTRKNLISTAMANHGAQWGERIRRCINEHLNEEEEITVRELHREMTLAYDDFRMSPATLHRLMKGLHFPSKLQGQRYIFEWSDLVQRRSMYLSHIQEARSREDFIVYLDETWLFEGMMKQKGWVDKALSRFPSEREAARCSYGKTAGKIKGKRAIVVAAMSVKGIVPGSACVYVSERQSQEEATHCDMDAETFESWLITSIPHMHDAAEGRCVTIVMDNAPYHSRALQKVPRRSSTKQEIVEFLNAYGVELASDSTRSSLLDELDAFLASRGGRAAVCHLAAEAICQEMGVRLLRLPPFHYFFNPIESCWSALKRSLAETGKRSDKLDQMRTMTLQFLSGVTSQQCEGWITEAVGEENRAREKELLDREGRLKRELTEGSTASDSDDL